MKFWEAMKALDEGKCVRPVYWDPMFKIHNIQRMAVEIERKSYEEIIDFVNAHWEIAN